MNSQRKGYSSRAKIPSDILEQLNLGLDETKTLAEGLAIDFPCLARAIVPELSDTVSTELVKIQPLGILERMRQTANILQPHLPRLLNSRSDTARGWAAFIIGQDNQLKLPALLQAILPLAADEHFGVREWAWLATRPRIAAELPLALKILNRWTTSPDANLRRFASESTRPRGVWTKQIPELIRQPELALPLLEALRSDPAEYVQLSVANWLNDAGKSQPTWLQEVTTRWLAESPTNETRKIVSRALRNQK